MNKFLKCLQVPCLKNGDRKAGVHNCNSSTQEAEAGGAQVLGQPGLHIKTLFQKKQLIAIMMITVIPPT
jgi:hypothetical protein